MLGAVIGYRCGLRASVHTEYVVELAGKCRDNAWMDAPVTPKTWLTSAVKMAQS